TRPSDSSASTNLRSIRDSVDLTGHLRRCLVTEDRQGILDAGVNRLLQVRRQLVHIVHPGQQVALVGNLPLRQQGLQQCPTGAAQLGTQGDQTLEGQRQQRLFLQQTVGAE